VPPQPAATADVPAYPVAPTRGGRLRRRATLAGTGAVLLVAGGVGGVALGHEAASTGADETSVVQGTNPGPSDPDGDGFREHPGFRDRGTPPGSDGDGTPGGNGSTGGSGGDTSTGDGTT